MRTSSARLAKQVSERYLTPGNPTGLAGLLTHPAPRPALIKIYSRTLEALQSFPKDSAYRTSVEALTKHRLSIIEGTKPDGYDAWLQRTEQQRRHAEAHGNIKLVPQKGEPQYDERNMEWDATGLENELFEGAEGPFVPGEMEGMADRVMARIPAEEKEAMGKEEAQLKASFEKFVAEQYEKNGKQEVTAAQLQQWFDSEKAPETQEEAVREVEVENEPPLTAAQVSELEGKFGAGLLEEVIEVAKGELKLVGVMHKNKVWEELVEKAPEGQWNYFERARHVKGTQAPPS